jgi:hypothetical protein
VGSIAGGCHKVSGAAAVYAGGVDLREWIKGEHDGLADRFAHAIVANVPPDRWRERAGAGGSSIAWLRLHTAWHEDLAVQTAVRGREPLMVTWRHRLGLGSAPAAAGLGEAEDPQVTAAVDLDALDAYAAAVHEATGTWLDTLDLAELGGTPPAGRRISDLAGVSETDVPWLHAMWDGKPSAWFLQWEAVGHPQGHLGEMVSVRSRLGLSPF